MLRKTSSNPVLGTKIFPHSYIVSREAVQNDTESREGCSNEEISALLSPGYQQTHISSSIKAYKAYIIFPLIV